MEIAVYTGPTRYEVCRHPRRSNERWFFSKPNGSVIEAITTDRMRRKWVEICGYMMAPNRHHKFATFDLHDQLVAAWRPEWLEIYDKMRKFRKGRPAQLTPNQAWALIQPDLPDLGADPTGTIPRTDCWNWSDHERKLFLLMPVEDEDPSVCQTIRYRNGDGVVMGRSYTFDYHNGSAALTRNVADIEDRRVRIDPDFTRKIRITHLKRTCAVTDVLPDFDEEE